MKIETRQVRNGEWSSPINKDWSYEAFYKNHLASIGGKKATFDKSVKLFKEMDAALQRGAQVRATGPSECAREVYFCAMYDGWPFWEPRPCFAYRGPLPGVDIGEFYELRLIRVFD